MSKTGRVPASPALGMCVVVGVRSKMANAGGSGADGGDGGF